MVVCNAEIFINERSILFVMTYPDIIKYLRVRHMEDFNRRLQNQSDLRKMFDKLNEAEAKRGQAPKLSEKLYNALIKEYGYCTGSFRGGEERELRVNVTAETYNRHGTSQVVFRDLGTGRFTSKKNAFY